MISNNDYQHDLKALYRFVPNKSLGQLLDISPKNFILSKNFDLEFSYIEVCFTDQNSERLEIENKINILKTMRFSTEPKNGIFEIYQEFSYFANNMSKNVDKNITNYLRGKQSQKILDNGKQSGTDVLKTASKRAIKNTVEATGDLTGNKVADKIPKFSRSVPQNSSRTAKMKQKILYLIQKFQKNYVYLQKRDRKLQMIQGQYNNMIMKYQKIINHLNLVLIIGLKKIMIHMECVTPIVKLNLRLQLQINRKYWT